MSAVHLHFIKPSILSVWTFKERKNKLVQYFFNFEETINFVVKNMYLHWSLELIQIRDLLKRL